MSYPKKATPSPQFTESYSTADHSLLPSITGSPILARSKASPSKRSSPPPPEIHHRNQFIPKLQARLARHRSIRAKDPHKPVPRPSCPLFMPAVIGHPMHLISKSRSRSAFGKPTQSAWKLSPMPLPPPPPSKPRPPSASSRLREIRAKLRSRSLIILGNEKERDQREVGGVGGSRYYKELNGLRFDTCELPRATQMSVNIKRVNAEMKAMGSDLPCEAAAAIFVRGDSASLSHFQALISGVEGTPYAHGLYLFDINLPENYPAVPPSVSLLTTASGSVRFNPNLYDTGFVCLSIINTWRGEADESWNPNLSSMYQVLISVQSLVMTSEIANNEPGFETLKDESNENKAYTAVVRFANMRYAIADMILNPPLGFEDVVRRHFTVKKEQVLRDVREWVREVPPNKTTYGAIRLTETHNPAVLKMFARLGVKGSLVKAASEVTSALSQL